ncbi:MAG: MoaD/ThiS family protein [Sphingomicrobium sp.]
MRLLMFGRLSHLAIDSRDVPPSISDSAALRAHLGDQWPELNDLKVKMAVNRTLVHGIVPIGEDDEVAFLPPMSGG